MKNKKQKPQAVFDKNETRSWAWSLWMPIKNGRVCLTTQYPFKKLRHAKANWEEFKNVVAQAEKKITKPIKESTNEKQKTKIG